MNQPTLRLGLFPAILATTLAVSMASARPALASTRGDGSFALTTDSPSVPDSLTAAGLAIAPRYMKRPGDADLSLEGHVVSAGGSTAFEYGQIRQVCLPGDLVLITGSGPLSSVGLRGPIWQRPAAAVGWDVRYRAENYLEEKPSSGTSPLPGLTFPPPDDGLGALAGGGGFLAAGQSQGGQASLQSELDWGALRGFVAPEVKAMSNRVAVGAGVAVDGRLGPVTLGLGFEAERNLAHPASALAVNPFETRMSAGVRWFPFSWGYFQASYHLVPADAYGYRTQDVEVGIGTRLLGTWNPPLQLPQASISIPQATVSLPVAAAPVRRQRTHLVGHLLDSLAAGGGSLGGRQVGLKKRQGNRWVEAPEIATTDAGGRFEFDGLPEGTYEVVYRNSGHVPGEVGAEVSDSVSLERGMKAHVTMDLAWNQEATRATLEGRTIDVQWPPKPGFGAMTYQVIIKYRPDRPYVVGASPGPRRHVRFAVSRAVAGHELYYTIKFWRPGHRFGGAAAYGQSRYGLLKEQRR